MTDTQWIDAARAVSGADPTRPWLRFADKIPDSVCTWAAYAVITLEKLGQHVKAHCLKGVVGRISDPASNITDHIRNTAVAVHASDAEILYSLTDLMPYFQNTHLWTESMGVGIASHSLFKDLPVHFQTHLVQAQAIAKAAPTEISAVNLLCIAEGFFDAIERDLDTNGCCGGFARPYNPAIDVKIADSLRRRYVEKPQFVKIMAWSQFVPFVLHGNRPFAARLAEINNGVADVPHDNHKFQIGPETALAFVEWFRHMWPTGFTPSRQEILDLLWPAAEESASDSRLLYRLVTGDFRHGFRHDAEGHSLVFPSS